MANSPNATLKELAKRDYKYGFVTDIESDSMPPGLDEGVVRLISEKKQEPGWLLEWRLRALRRFLEMLEQETEPTWAQVTYPKIDYQNIIYYSAPKPKEPWPTHVKPSRTQSAPLRQRSSHVASSPSNCQQMW